MLNPDGSKTCASCHLPKPTSDFYAVTRKTGDGFHAYCKPCVKAKVIAWQKANPDKKAAQDKKTQAKRTPEQIERHKAAVAAWCKAHPAKVRGAVAKHRATHADELRARKREDYAANPEKYRVHERKHRAKPENKEKHRVRAHLNRDTYQGLRSTSDPNSLTPAQWAAVLAAFDQKCAYCGSDGGGKKLTIDHVVPFVRGGAHMIGNVVPACRACNSSKKERPFEVFCRERGLDAAAIIDRGCIDA